MPKNSKIILIVIIIIILLFIPLFYYVKSYMPKYRWNENYSYKNDQPYGLKLIYDLFSKSFKGNNFVLVNKPPKDYIQKADTGSIYFFIGANYMIDSLTSTAICEFVKRGNNAFISSIESTHLLYDKLTKGEQPLFYTNYNYDSLINITFFDSLDYSSFRFNYKIAKKTYSRQWIGISNEFFNDTLLNYGFRTISSMDYGLIDCYKIKYGKGWFIFHQNPILFTNYYTSTKDGFNYINSLLHKFKKQKIYWDEFSKTPVSLNFSNPSHMSPLRFILSERSLRWTWYLICLFSLIFILFNSKRKQAFIPLISVNKNTTVEYLNALAIIHYKNKSVGFITDEMMKQFLSFVKQKYGISPQTDKKILPGLLAPKSGIPEEKIIQMIDYYMDVKYTLTPEYKDLTNFYLLLDYFYNNCK